MLFISPGADGLRFPYFFPFFFTGGFFFAGAFTGFFAKGITSIPLVWYNNPPVIG